MPAQARVGDSVTGTTNYGQPGCPHRVQGTIIEGAGQSLTNGLASARIGDRFVCSCPHVPVGTLIEGSGTALFEGIGGSRIGERGQTPGGQFNIISASPDVITGG